MVQFFNSKRIGNTKHENIWYCRNLSMEVLRNTIYVSMYMYVVHGVMYNWHALKLPSSDKKNMKLNN